MELKDLFRGLLNDIQREIITAEIHIIQLLCRTRGVTS